LFITSLARDPTKKIRHWLRRISPTAHERKARARQMLGIYALKCTLDSSDDRGSGVVAGTVDILLENALQKVVQGVQIRRRRRLTVLFNEMGHGPPAEFMSLRGRLEKCVAANGGFF
jgi:hypothetical protein